MAPGSALAAQLVNPTSFPKPNFAHFNHLMAPAQIGGRAVEVLNIYSSAPDFHPVEAPGEGYACVDDAARGIVLLSASLEARNDPVQQTQLEALVKFVLAMQNENGYFNNFIKPDGKINRGSRTSVAELNWWSLRALWGLEAGYRHLRPTSQLAGELTGATARLVANLKRDLPVGRIGSAHINGRAVPGWLPSRTGADQAAVAVLGLLLYEQRTHDGQARLLIAAMADGIKAMQAGNARQYPFGVHLSWRNRWHAWGSDQPYALMLAGRQLQRKDLLDSGLSEVTDFYPYLLDHGPVSEFGVGKKGERYVPLQVSRYPQIAYGIRPMVFAADEAWRITGQERYRKIARRFAAWLTGSNSARQAVYDANSGRVSDGIVEGNRLNPNSGAESTIEGLMALQRVADEEPR